MHKYVYSFNEGSKDMRSLLGGKGANLAEMTRIGLPVPFGFTVSTEGCFSYYENGGSLSEEPAARLRPFRRGHLHAGHDGHHPEPGYER